MFTNRPEKAFAYFCCRAKGRRRTGRDPPVQPLVLNKDEELEKIDLLLPTFQTMGRGISKNMPVCRSTMKTI